MGKEPIDWEKAVKEARPPLPMEAEIWAAGADLETAHFVARMLRQRGYYLFKPDSLDWDDINRFHEQKRNGQGVLEDAGGYVVRCIRSLLRFPVDEVEGYRDAVKRMMDEQV